MRQELIAIIKTRHFQRLKRIHQLGPAVFVYPTANHSRFHHSIGTCELSLRVLDRFQCLYGTEVVTPRIYRYVSVAALIHDIGHGPYSHTYEKYRKQDDRSWTHEIQTIRVFQHMVNEYQLPYTDFDINEIMQIIHPSQTQSSIWYYQIVANLVNGIDVDKLDYITRDWYHLTKTTCYHIADSIIANMYIHNSTSSIVYTASCVPDIVELLTRRRFLHRIVIQNSVVSQYETAILTSFQQQQIDTVTIDDFLNLDEHVVDVSSLTSPVSATPHSLLDGDYVGFRYHRHIPLAENIQMIDGSVLATYITLLA